MKHIIISDKWQFGTDPFPAYRCSLVYGRNQRDREFLPTNGITPTEFAVFKSGHEKQGPEYKGTLDGARKVADEWNKDHPKGTYAQAYVTHHGVLPENKFCVIKTQEKGTILAVSGEDKTNRCLLFVVCAGGFRGGVSVLTDGTTGTILIKCSAGNACESSVEAIAILAIGQSIAFHTSGRRTNEVYQYLWNGKEVEKKHYSKAEWDSRSVAIAPQTAKAEVL